jgi:type IV pilus assembly protein PilB
MSKALAEFLLKEKIVTAAQFQQAQVHLASTNATVGFVKFFVEKKIISDQKLVEFLSKRYNLPSINLSKFEINPDIIKLVPIEIARKSQVIPIQSKAGTLVVALWDPTQIIRLDDVKFHSKLNVEAVLTSISNFETVFQKHYGSMGIVESALQSIKKEKSSQATTKAESAGIELVEVHEIDHNENFDDAPVINLVNGLLGECIRRGASDIHVEPYEKKFRVRLRIDGVLHDITEIPIEMKRAVVARLKIMSRMDIAESRIPQDGRIKLKSSGKEIDFRVNTLPTLFGEKVVLRMLSQGNLQLDLTKLGFEQKQLEVFKKGIYAPNGMVLVTGPTGSGKTTTLYSALSELNQVTDNISTAEDPVEYNLEGVNQVQVNKEIGLSFANVLRSLLRQDPDTILVGEIRDYETAEVAVQAALTGHLVLSTLHTNDAPSTITRLMNMGLEPFLVTSSLNTIVAQRLLRTLCPKCTEPQVVTPEYLVSLGFSKETLSQFKPMVGRGCTSCNQSGYKGRIAIYEVLDFSQNLKEMVLRGETSIAIKAQAMKDGMKSLRQSALTKVAEGRTSLQEALSLTMEN